MSLRASEYEILALLWSNPEGLTASEINKQGQSKSWKDASIHLILSRMLKRNIIAVGGVSRSGKTYGRIFKAAITPEQYALMQVEKNSIYFEDKRISGIFAALVDSKEVSSETICQIEKLLKEKKEES